MYIKIYTKSQLVLLRGVNRLFRKKYRLPQEILNRVEAILMVKELGENGFVAVPVHIVQDRAGHQDPKITLKVYSHVAKDNKRVVAELLDEKLFRASNE